MVLVRHIEPMDLHAEQLDQRGHRHAAQAPGRDPTTGASWIGLASRPADCGHAQRRPGGRRLGESHHQDALTAIVGGKGAESVRIPTQATLVPEPDNPYDPNAVAVYIAGRKVGHLPRPAAQAFAPVGRRLAEQRQVGACSATITGGWDRGDGDTRHFGITLDLAHPDQLL
jgi:hypothetical protein